MLLLGLLFVDFVGIYSQDNRDPQPPAIQFSAHKSPTNQIYISPSGRMLLACSMTEELSLWKRTGKEFKRVSSLRTSYQLDDVVVGDNDIVFGHCEDSGRVVISNMTSGKITRAKVLTHEMGAKRVLRWPTLALSPTSNVLAYTSIKDGALELWELKSRSQQPPIRLLSPGERAVKIAFAPAMSRIATVNVDNRWQYCIRLWDSRTHSLMGKVDLPADAGPIFTVAFSMDNKQLVVAYGKELGWECEFGIWDVSTKRLRRIGFPANGNAKVKAVTIRPGFDKAYSCDNGGVVFEYSLLRKTRRLIHKADDDFRSIAISPRVDYLAVGGWSGTITIIPFAPLDNKSRKDDR